ncbi:MAG: potassium channel family protein [Solirubrobacteraceae bacterium]
MTDGTVVASGAPDRIRRRRYGALLICCIILVGIQGIFPPGAVQQVLVAINAGACLLLAVRSARLGAGAQRIAQVLAVTAIVVGFLHALDAGVSDGAARLCVAALLALGPPAVAIGILRDLRASGRVEVHAIAGVLALYLMIGMAFAFLYGGIDHVASTPFFADNVPATVSRCLYFSFTTLTTVGYGDMVADTDLGRTLAIFEALMGQIYLVTIVSLLVGNLGRPTRVAAGRVPEQ